jgi:hypothetical protein
VPQCAPDIKNTALPEALLAEVRRRAKVVQEAVERLLCFKRREMLYAYGEDQAEKLGIQESDVSKLVLQVCSETERER